MTRVITLKTAIMTKNDVFQGFGRMKTDSIYRVHAVCMLALNLILQQTFFY